MLKICVLLVHFNPFSTFMDYWLKSASLNKDIDFLILADDKAIEEKSASIKNIKFKYITLNDVKDRIRQKLDPSFVFEHYYKICDYKPTFGIIFDDLIKGYDYWGYCDPDIIMGDIKSFLTDDLISKNSKIMKWGHFSLIKNNYECNNMFTKIIQNSFNYKTVFTHSIGFCFDEGPFFQRYELANLATFNDENLIADLFIDRYDFKLARSKITNRPCNFYWENGKLYCAYQNGRKIDFCEILYVHFQKRKLKCQPAKIEDISNFYLRPNEILLNVTPDFLKNIKIKKHFNHLIYFLKNKYKRLQRKIKQRAIKKVEIK